MNTQKKTTRNHRRTGMAVGLSAGLIGGAAAGLAFGIPGATSAATPESAAIEAAALVAQVDTPEDGTEAGGGTVDRVAVRTERIRAALDELVAAGTVTAEQADAVAAHLSEQVPVRDRGDRLERRAQRAERREFVTELLGVDAETLRDELRSGATLAEVAEANGVSTDELVDALVARAMERLDAAVEAGRIDQATADEKSAELEASITERVTTPRGERGAEN